MWIARYYATVFTLFYSQVFAEYIIGNASSWEEAKQSCSRLATPSITYNENGAFVDNRSIQALSVNADEELWVGYIQAYQVFQYIGCVDLGKEKDNDKRKWERMYILLRADIGQCFSACNTTFLGIVGILHYTACYCLAERFISSGDKNIYCDRACAHPLQTACGGKSEQRTYVSLYERVNDFHHIPKTLGKDNCVASNRSDLIWMDCREKHPRICQHPNGDTDLIRIDGKSDWKATENSCFQEHKYPLTYEHVTTGIAKNSTLYWTGMIRALVTFPYKDLGSTHYVKLGYIGKYGNDLELLFTNTNDATARRFFCEKKEIPKTVDQNKETSLTTSTAISSSTVSKQESTKANIDAEIIAFDSNMEKTATKEGTENHTSSLTIGLAVGVGVLVLVIAVVVLQVIIRRRRRQKPVQTVQNEESNGEVCCDTATNEDHSQTTTGQKYTPVKTYDEENTYDSASNENLNQSDNIYNHTNTHSDKNMTPIADDTYNHINVTPKRSVNNEDETYDTTETSAAGNVQSKLRTAGETENVYNTFENGEDSIYNSTTLQRQGNGNADDYDSCSNVVGAK